MRTQYSCVRRILLCGILAIISSAAHAATYYVSPAGSDTGAGSSTSPWLTIQKAADSMAPGDTVLIADGVYTNSVTVRNGGAVGAPITFKSINKGGAVISVDPTVPVDAFLVTYSPYVVVDGLTVQNGNRGIRFDHSNAGVARNCTVLNSLITGIFTDFSDDMLVEYNECAFSGQQHGIYISTAADRPIVRYNVCHDNPRAGVQLNGDGKTLIPSLGTQADGMINGAQIIGNVLYNNGLLNEAAAINLLCVSTSLIANNLLYNNIAGGISLSNDNLAAATQWGCKNNSLLNNTIYFQPNQGRWCLTARHGSSNNLAQNNIIYGGYRGAYLFDATSSFVADFNIVDTAGVVGEASDADTITFYTFAQWQQLSGNDYNSAEIDPQFVNESSAPFDFHVTSGSPAINNGVWHQGITVDIDGNARPLGAVCDIGCYQSGAPLTYSISGHVLYNGVGIGGVTVTAAAVQATSAPDGSYTLIGLPAGTYTITSTTTGYTVTASPTATVGPGSATGVDVSVASVLGALSISPAKVAGAASTTGTITLIAQAPAGGLTLSLNSSSSAASVPASVTVAAGATTAAFTVTTTAVSSDTTVTVTATFGVTSTTASLLVTAPSSATVALSPSSVTGGTSSTATVTLSSAAPAGGSIVTLSSNNAAATVPSSVTVSVGATSASFTVGTTAVALDSQATITASLNGSSATGILKVNAARLSTLTLNPTTVAGGKTSTGTVTLSGPAPINGVTVALSSGSTAATAPATVSVNSGASSASFTIQTGNVGVDTAAKITATLGTVVSTATLTVKASTTMAASLSPATVSGGSISTLTVTLSGAAPAGGAVVKLTSSSANATVPAIVTVPAGATSATAAVQTKGVSSDTSAVISASYGGTTASATLTIQKVQLASVSVSPSTINGGSSATGTVTLTGFAPQNGSVVTLSSSDTDHARVPSSVTVAAGRSSVTFTVTTRRSGHTRTITITATLGSITKQTTITVQSD